MKPYIFLFIVGLNSFSNVYCQNAYYDAIVLAKKAHINSQGRIVLDDSTKKILSMYWPHSIDTNRLTIDSFYKKNPFFVYTSDTSKSIFQASGAASASSSFNYHSIASSVGNLDVTSIADGLARFLIKRGKEELNIAFFQRMKEFLDSNIEARTLFPSTDKFLGSIASYRYSEFLQSLREAFYKDISNLIVNLNLLIDLPKYQNLLKALPEIRVAIRSAKIISELSQADSSMHPANLIAYFAALNEWGEMNINLQSSWKVLDEISKSVRKADYTIKVRYDTSILKKYTRDSTINPGGSVIDTIKLTGNFYKLDPIGTGKDTIVRLKSKDSLIFTPRYDTVKNEVAWIKFSDFNANILSDTTTLKIYLGLLYQKMDTIKFRNSRGELTYVRDFMDSNKTDIFKIADLVENFLVLANDVEQSISEIRSKKDKGLTNDDYYTYIQKAIDVVDYGFKVANVIKKDIADDRYIAMSRNANSLYKNIYTKNYNAAIMNGYLILEEVLSKSKDAIGDKDSLFVNSAATISHAASANFTAAKSALATSKFLEPTPTTKRSKLVEDILKYGNVMASIIKAENPEDAEAAIEAAVLPAGNSSIKKNTAWNLSLNAYIGGYFGRTSNSTDEIDGDNSKIGVTAPVGVALSKGLGHYKNGSSIGALSLFVSLIDVGAIAGYRLNDDSTALDQKVTLNEIFTPGGYLVYGFGLPFKGFPYIPLSVGYGWQYGSTLYYKKSNGKLDVSDKSRWRSNWFIAVDIPLANFWTRNYKKKG